MADSDKPGVGVPGQRGSAGLRSGAGGRETVLLGDVPDVVPDAAPAAPETVISSRTNLGVATNVLAALGQRYEILGEAGHGSMGNVYKARDRETGETVALKLLKPEIASDQAMMDRFKNELLFARKITHKNVCRVYEFNRIGGIAYTSMEFVEGESLRSVLNRFGALSQKKATDLALQICSGLKEAHAQGIVHRDLKPENVMIDGSGNLKLMDFGIARSMEVLTRQTGAMVGTPAYMAPEQVSGSPVDYRTDVYSLGLMLYEMFTGKPAFSAENAIAVALKQMREDPPPPHDIDPAISLPIERAILKCLEKSPAKRFQTVAELESALQTHAAAVPVLAAPAGAQPVVAAANAPRVPASLPPRTLSQPSLRRESSFWLGAVRIVVGATIVMGILLGMHWAAVARAVAKIPPPASPSAPVPPDFAYEIPVPSTAAPTEEAEIPAPPKAAVTKPAAAAKTPEAHAKLATPEVFPRMEVGPGKRSLPDPSKWIAAQNALAQQKQAKQSSMIYLKADQFLKESKAQEAAKKIRALGLPVRVQTWHGAKATLYVTLVGPIAAGGAKAVTNQLKAEGFKNVEKVRSASVE
jgi:serine/threonine protein kinase